MKFIDGIILNCEQTFDNCESCFFKLNSDLQCLKCNEMSLFIKEKNKCAIITKIEFENSFITYLDNDFYLKECKEGYFYQNLENLCHKIRLDCNFGCNKCYGKNKNCIDCFETFNLSNNSCNFLNSKSKIQEDSKNFEKILQYFYYSENACKNIINNITLFMENNITTYFNENNYVNAKTYEVEEFYINCSEKRSKCLEYNGKKNDLLKVGLTNCSKIYNENHIVIVNQIKNITINDNLNYCKESETIINYKEKIECGDIKCLDYKKIKQFRNFTNIIKCSNNYKLKHKTVKKIKDKSEIINCDYCQKDEKFFCEWDENCKKQCDFEIKNNSEYSYLKITDPNSKINISTIKLNLKIPNYLTIEFDYVNQKIIFKFFKNVPNYVFKLKPSCIISAQNCVFKSEKKFKIKNKNYIKSAEFFKDLNPTQNEVSSLIFTSAGLGSFAFIPNSFYEILQFNDLFSYFGYLNINGGSFFNFIFSLQKNNNDLDKQLLDKKKEYEYQMVLKKFKNLITISLIDYYLIIGIIFIFLFRIYLNRTIYSRYLKMCKSYFECKNSKPKNQNFFQKFYYKLKLQYILFDLFYLLFYYEKIIFMQYIFRLPHYVIIFTYKYYLIDERYFIVYFFFFLIISIFLLKVIIRTFQFLKINSISLFKEVMIIENNEFNWFFVFYNTVFVFLNLINVFVICFLRDIPEVCFVIIIMLIITENILIFCFIKKKLLVNIILNFFTSFFFFLWIIFVSLDKFFRKNFPICKNCFYCVANVLKLISNFYLSRTLKKLK